MSWRIVSVSKRSYLSLSNNNLKIKQGEEEYTVPLEDIGTLLIEDQSVTMSAALLDACIKHKIAAFICDEKHIPSGILLGYQQHSRQSKVLFDQVSWTEPFKKRSWQNVIKQKITNQKSVLEKIKGNGYPSLESYIQSVKSGDPLNREATAARLYFSELFPVDCTRGSEHILNSALNYGYAILRGAIARSLVSYGFLSSLGIQHRNELNNFALADDFIEPYRPCVDYFVFTQIPKEEFFLTKEMRNNLVSILTHHVQLDGKRQNIMRAMEVTAQSLTTATNAKDPNLLLLPELLYE